MAPTSQRRSTKTYEIHDFQYEIHDFQYEIHDFQYEINNSMVYSGPNRWVYFLAQAEPMFYSEFFTALLMLAFFFVETYGE